MYSQRGEISVKYFLSLECGKEDTQAGWFDRVTRQESGGADSEGMK